MSNSSDKFVLVVGATGATGKFVVQNLLDQRRKVKVIVRSETKLMNLLKEGLESNAEFVVKEAPSLFGLKDDELTSFVGDCDTIVQCLGHNITYQGMYKDGYFVSGAVEKLTTIMPDGCRFILMGSDGVAHPDGKTDPKRTLGERCVYFLLRCLVPPHVDNEKAALYLHEKCSNRKDWVVVRPTNLIDVDVADGKYENFTSQQVSPIFGDREVSRANVAHFMTQLVTDKRLFEKYSHFMPIIYNIKTTDRGSKESKKAK